MKIGTLTFHTAHNYGAVLQAYALVKFFQKLGHQAEIIDYRCIFNEARFSPTPFYKHLHPRSLYHIIFNNSYQKPCPKAFIPFIENYLTKSAIVYNYESLAEAEKCYDRIVAGSDQIWNLACTEEDDSYFLPFCSKEKKRAYAASFGVPKIQEYYKDKVKHMLSSYATVSVRENEGAEIVYNLLGKKAETVLDPTLLLNEEEWRAIADTTKCPSEKYLIMYLMYEDNELMNFAVRYGKEHGLRVLYISQRLFKKCKAEYLRDVTPNQWIGLFLNADTIVSNSFHGSAFGVNFMKNLFIKYIPNGETNSRLKTLVDDYSLHSHLLANEIICDRKFGDLDFMLIKRKLEDKRTKSTKYITDYILK